MDEIVLAVDPGREKAGIAVVSRERGTMHKCVIEASECVEQVCELAEKHGVARIVIGDRTGSSEIIEALGHVCDLEIIAVDEHMSSMEARERYLRENPGKGIARFLPIGLRTPKEPYDDYVAEILAARYFDSVS
ncbi:MAG TPA: Holliday junction resolvase RuvX [Bacillota bacterium]|nr:pre-16S rRNA-processing nuclease YqgF [Bacillota bacterium]HOB41582.1 Holliday junction resolvase RuvX [Bacillota bacterium]HOK70550.1 Holliday junction resolvase RuvX [Bacillota bacterium]HOL52407.1 Holliday junction resolvase RuvX [Bacillota bacterium]HOO30739.1 Holliday junction resolvase RuvX [Bacillota bacterium]